MMLDKFLRMHFGTLRSQLMFGVAVIIAVSMAFFVWKITERQAAFFLERQTDQVTAQAQTLASSSAGWLATHDFSGLQELVELQSRYPELQFAMLLDEHGHVVAHTDSSRIGMYVGDMPPRIQQTVLSRSSGLADVIVPAMLAGRHVGWARVGISQRKAGQRQEEIVFEGVLFGLSAIFASLLLAWFAINRLTSRLYAIQTVIDKVRSGDGKARCMLTGNDEAAMLSNEFNGMLDMLEEHGCELDSSRKALIENEERFQLFMRHFPGLAYIKDSETRALFVNDGFEKYLHLKPSDMIGRTNIENFPLDFAKKMTEDDKRILSLEKPDVMEETFAGRIWSTHKFLIPQTGKPPLLGGFTIDITEQKQAVEALRKSEEKFRTLADYTNDWEVWIGPNQECLYVSPSCFEITGYRAVEFQSDRSLMRSIVYADDIEIFERHIRVHSELDAPRIREEVEFRIVTRSGDVRWLNHICSAVYSAGLKYMGRRVSNRDVTDRKKAEGELSKYREHLEELVHERTLDLEQMREALLNIVEDLNVKTVELETANVKLQELDRLKSMFIASMSHELRTPLNAIIGFSSVLHDEWLGPVTAEQKVRLAGIQSSGKHLLLLINDVIDVSKIESGKIKSRIEEFELDDIIKEAVSLLKSDIEDKGLSLIIESSRQKMRTDRQRLLQSVINILSNAVKYTEIGGVTLKSSMISQNEITMANISVEDTGIGIEAKDLSKLFQPFSRISSDTNITTPGTGLGLYLTKKLVTDILGGGITVESECGKGSKFTITIPTRID